MFFKNKIGFIQGRLSPIIDNKIQIFPSLHWKDEYKKSKKIGLNLLEWTLDEETFDSNPLLTKVGREEIKKYNEDYDISIPSLTCDYAMQNPFWKLEGEVSNKIIYNFLKIIESCEILGVNIIVVPLVDNGSIKSLKQEEFLIKFFSKISQILIDSNILIAFESDYNPYELQRFINNFDKNIGINFDMGNSASNGYDPTTEILALGARIINVHVKDRLLNGTTVPLNEGNCDFIKVFKSLKEINYKNNYILQTARAIDQNHEKVLNDYVNMTLEWLENA